MRFYHGIAALRRLIDPRQMASLKEPSDVRQQYCYSQEWMKSGGGQTLRNAVAICETSETSWQMGKHHKKDDLEDHSKGQQLLVEQWLNIISLVFNEGSVENSSTWRESITRSLSGP